MDPGAPGGDHPSTMFNEIWVVCDEGSEPDPALRVGADLARRAGADLRVIQVLASKDDALGFPPAPLPAGIPATVSVLTGRRDEVTLAAIKREKPDVVVIAPTGGEGRLSGMLRGTHGTTLLREAECPVVFVPPEPDSTAARPRS